MTRYALVLGSRSCPTLSAAAVCPSLDRCTAPTPHKTITVLYKPALWVLLMIEDRGLAVTDNPSYEQWRLTATNEPRTGDVEVACSGQIDMAETHSNGYVYDKLLGPDLQRILCETYDSAALTPDLRRACELRAINKNHKLNLRKIYAKLTQNLGKTYDHINAVISQS